MLLLFAYLLYLNIVIGNKLYNYLEQLPFICFNLVDLFTTTKQLPFWNYVRMKNVKLKISCFFLKESYDPMVACGKICTIQ